MPQAELRCWLHDPDPQKFPYDVVVRHYHQVGKHFVAPELLSILSRVREVLPTLYCPWPDVQLLSAFLSTALDKPDGRYDYPTYLALDLLQLPSVDDPVERAAFARSRCDRLVAQLVTDALAFELAALDGRTTLLPEMRPTPDVVAKRCKHGLRVIRPALARMSLDGGLGASDPVGLVRQACSVVTADMSLAERQAIALGVLPVYTSHDEYLFLRVLQAFETTFALLTVQLMAAIDALDERKVDRALHFVNGSATALREAAPLFSLLATMQIESFRTFREFTEGASAIQSRNYKLVESLCRTPDATRVDSPAYHSVPEVHTRVLRGRRTLDDAYLAARDSGDLDERDRERLEFALADFARALLRWRQTHYRLAVRMLGEATGTGYTEGTPYLKSVRDIPVFRTVDAPGAMSDEGTARTR
ncbi:tryptophan 2,3-dioxygenase family protein [Streptomyces mangrovisoli]|uniref:Tryptophan 2,3-dioxygenase n=1 Tax=Streptomyces mangrovisoli TaxID=1428628 RepID=A0A1J4NMV7_9ACTN|nr:tryptophan 2,3-dioxygenase family protein [Streptomyces mangrovisoli]OIJ63635.1 tryptophan 2,3-dioxygenase [Streptomyces mangrovisoli]